MATTRRDAAFRPAPPCRNRTGSCQVRREHFEERIASIGIDVDATYYLVDDLENTYVCEIRHCPWCGSLLRPTAAETVARTAFAKKRRARGGGDGA